jgi:DNA-directed RNA polymerase specialized sigma24 family protein
VMLRYFAGLSVEETAAALDISPATVKNDWSYARAWLHRELNRQDSAVVGEVTERSALIDEHGR